MIDGESFEEHAKWGFQNGAIVNFYWEAKNPSNSADSYNGNNNPISEITEGGAYNGTGMLCLDCVWWRVHFPSNVRTCDPYACSFASSQMFGQDGWIQSRISRTI